MTKRRAWSAQDAPTPQAGRARRGALFTGACLFAALSSSAGSAAAQSPDLRRWYGAAFVEAAAAFVPVANDVPVMVGFGVRARGTHEVLARLGYMPVGDDVGHAFGLVGYRAVLRPGQMIRPILGAYFAGLPATCGHNDYGKPLCTPDKLFIAAGTAGVRWEPHPSVGLAALLSLGLDSYPNPFGMLEIATTFALPLGRGR